MDVMGIRKEPQKIVLIDINLVANRTDIEVLALLLRERREDGTSILSASSRKDLMKKLGLKNRQSITMSLGRLLQAGLISGTRGQYSITAPIITIDDTEQQQQRDAYNAWRTSTKSGEPEWGSEDNVRPTQREEGSDLDTKSGVR